MPRRPKENYHQMNGRPHSALENPGKYGLTFGEAVAIIEAGQWKAFYFRWYRRQKKKVCTGCNNEGKIVFQTGNQSLCQECVNLLEEFERCSKDF